jgi:hypothetical protein
VGEGEVLIGEGLGAVDAGGARAVAVEKVPALDHEIFDLFFGVRFFGYLLERQRGGDTRFGGIYCLCSLAAVPDGSSSRRCRIAGSSRRSWERHLRRVRRLPGLVALLVFHQQWS